uniref:Uncharacterized protein n=1 Tax=Marseillevirus LCMAC201 TaxID=2506605 RepID=A0A481YWT1_9VIRU|nr:MAG: hypothetical protein LCMAC201_03900 [Marseillevirus LCMAC201]
MVLSTVVTKEAQAADRKRAREETGELPRKRKKQNELYNFDN